MGVILDDLDSLDDAGLPFQLFDTKLPSRDFHNYYSFGKIYTRLLASSFLLFLDDLDALGALDDLDALDPLDDAGGDVGVDAGGEVGIDDGGELEVGIDDGGNSVSTTGGNSVSTTGGNSVRRSVSTTGGNSVRPTYTQLGYLRIPTCKHTRLVLETRRAGDHNSLRFLSYCHKMCKSNHQFHSLDLHISRHSPQSSDHWRRCAGQGT